MTASAGLLLFILLLQCQVRIETTSFIHIAQSTQNTSPDCSRKGSDDPTPEPTVPPTAAPLIPPATSAVAVPFADHCTLCLNAVDGYSCDHDGYATSVVIYKLFVDPSYFFGALQLTRI